MHRSYLYVPGNRADRLTKALGLGADALIADLEDAVAPDAKDAARSGVSAFLADRRGAPDGPEVLVRVNPAGQMPGLLEQDLRAVVPAGARTIYLPKADLASMQRVHDVLTSIESDLGLPGNSVAVVALVESATGMLEVAELARHHRVRNLAIGESDLTADLGIELTDHEAVPPAIWSLRMHLVVASAAAGIDPPTGPVDTDFRDLDALGESTTALRRAGFAARSAIHPAQVGVINEVFTPSAAEVGRAERLVELFDSSVARGDGVCVDDHGRMVDEAVIRSARRVLSRRSGR